MIKNLLLFSRQMVSTMEDKVIATLSIILLCAAMKLLKKRKVKRNCCTRHWIKQRNVFGAHHALLEELRREDPNSYKDFLIPPIYSINLLLLSMQQQAFPHQYLRSQSCFTRTMCFNYRCIYYGTYARNLKCMILIG